jgi:hypothetical protein
MPLKSHPVSGYNERSPTGNPDQLPNYQSASFNERVGRVRVASPGLRTLALRGLRTHPQLEAERRLGGSQTSSVQAVQFLIGGLTLFRRRPALPAPAEQTEAAEGG